MYIMILPISFGWYPVFLLQTPVQILNPEELIAIFILMTTAGI